MAEEIHSQIVCVVEDDPGLNGVLCQLLQEGGFEVRAFPSGTEFLQQLSQIERYDLIISDINMPGISGYDLCRKIRTDKKLGRIPVILITGSDASAEKADGLEAGADDFISKPFSMKDLLAKVSSLLRIRAEEVQTLGRLRKFLSPNIATLLAGEDQESLLKPHRAEVTVVFVDLRRFTSFSERVEPEEVLSVLSGYYTAVGNAAIKYKGTLGHLAGDGIMVFFNDPEPVEHHRETALCMAVEAREQLLLQKLAWDERRYGIDFGFGVSEGFATIGGIGFDRFSHYSVIGPVANIASRLCGAADGGQILVSDRFLSRIDASGFRTQTIGEIQLKGIETAVLVHNVLGLQNRIRMAG